MDAREVVHARADGSASLWRQQLRVAPNDMGLLHFSWKVPGLIANADMAVRETDDSPVRIVLAFDGDRSKLSSKSQALSDLARALTGEELPYATLMYVWSNTQPTESVILNPRTDRIRKIVVESGDGQLNQWLDYTRDVRADYERAFGEAPGALLSVALMTDADNTRSRRPPPGTARLCLSRRCRCMFHAELIGAACTAWRAATMAARNPTTCLPFHGSSPASKPWSVMVVVALVAFVLFQHVGDPVVFFAGARDRDAGSAAGACAPTSVLDRPFFIQFFHFAANAVQGEFGLSLRQGAKVSRLLAERFPATLELTLVAAALALALGMVPMA